MDRYRSREQLERKREQTSLRTLLQKRLEERFNWADQALLNLLVAWGGYIQSPADADEFMEWIQLTRKVKPSTLARYVATLKKLDKANFGHISIKQESLGIPVAYTLEQQRAILDFLRTSREYGHYHDLVKFFLARP